MLVGDAGRVRQVLTNLIGNAVKFTDSGRIDVEAEMVRPTGDGFLVRFSVRDTGIGIPPEHQSRLFESFTFRGMARAPENTAAPAWGFPYRSNWWN